jgi:hypothetical protein
MSKQFLVFQHMPWEGPGQRLIRLAGKFGMNLHIVEVWHQTIPDISLYNGLIVLGGSPNVDQKAVDGRDKVSPKWSFKSEPLRWSSWEKRL